MPTYARPPRRGDQFTHLRSLDLNWTPGPGQLYGDAPKARQVVTADRRFLRAVRASAAAGLVLGILHLLIDTRVPVTFWIRYFKKCNHSPDASSIAIWLDQTLHIVCLGGWLWLRGS